MRVVSLAALLLIADLALGGRRGQQVHKTIMPVKALRVCENEH
jgi:hypothetical protein